MKRIGLLSDTHGFLHPEIPRIFSSCDEIWHAGDFGSLKVAEELNSIKPLRGVHGNIDGQEIRRIYPRFLRFRCEDADILVTHIGGYPDRYTPEVRPIIESGPPDVFISGHSHILKVMPDQRNQLLHINPGAAGKSGFHRVITMVRFSIDSKQIKDLEVVEFKRY